MAATARWLAKEGWNVRVVTVQPSYPVNQRFENVFQGECIEDGVRVWRLPAPSFKRATILSRVFPEFSFLALLAWLRITGRLKTQERVISLCPSIFATLGGKLLTKRGGRHISIVHDIPSGLGQALGWKRHGLALKITRWIERFALNQAQAVVTLSTYMETELKRLGVRRPIYVEPPHLDVSSLAWQPATLDALIWMYSGNLGRKQGLDQLIEVAQWLQHNRPEIRFIIQGEGSQREQLEAEVSRRQLTNVEFKGLAAREALATSLGMAAIHVVPQVPGSNGFVVPSKIYTLMAIGRPFVAVAEPGSLLDELAQETGAFLVAAPGDLQALTQACVSLSEDVGARAAMGRRGRAYVERIADTEVVMSLFADLLSRPHVVKGEPALGTAIA